MYRTVIIDPNGFPITDFQLEIYGLDKDVIKANYASLEDIGATLNLITDTLPSCYHADYETVFIPDIRTKLEIFKASPVGFSPFNTRIENIALNLFDAMNELDELARTQNTNITDVKNLTARALLNLELHNDTLCRSEG